MEVGLNGVFWIMGIIFLKVHNEFNTYLKIVIKINVNNDL